MYRADGPTEMKPVGETEFVNGTSAMSASGQYGPTRLCRAIVGHADLPLGDGVASRAGGPDHGRGWPLSWHPPFPIAVGCKRDAFPSPRTHPIKGQTLDPTRRAGFARLSPLDLHLRGLALPSPASPSLPTSPAPTRRPRSSSTMSAGRRLGPTRTRRPKPLRSGRPALLRSGNSRTSSSSSAGSACR